LLIKSYIHHSTISSINSTMKPLPPFLIELLKLACPGYDCCQSGIGKNSFRAANRLLFYMFPLSGKQIEMAIRMQSLIFCWEFQFRSPWAGSLVHCLSRLGFAKAEKKRRYLWEGVTLMIRLERDNSKVLSEFI